MLSLCLVLAVYIMFFFFFFFLSLRVWDPKLMNPKISDQPQLQPVLPPVNISLIVSIRSSLTHLHGFQLLVLLP